jgi:sn-glycerol 3-phosphate transport system ATP-binding protein
MSKGEVQQVGTTDDIYNRPANTFVAAFMGSPPMNLMPGVVRGGSLDVGDATVTAVSEPEGPVTVGVRPEHLGMHGSCADGMVPARVDFVEPLGSHVLVTAILADETRVIAQAPPGIAWESGTRIGLALPPERTYFFDADTGAARPGRQSDRLSAAGPQ